MPKVQTITTNFTAGVLSPRLRGRVDIDKYPASLRDASNAVVMRHGGVTARPSLDYVAAIRDEAQQARLVPFVFSNTVSYIIEFGSAKIRFFKNGALVETSPGVPYEVVTGYLPGEQFEMDYLQSGDTLIMAHPLHPLFRLRRFSDARWVFDVAPVAPGPIAELGARQNTTLTLSAATTGAGRNVTAAAAFFKPGDLGRTLTCIGGRAEITTYTSSTAVVVTTYEAFASTTLTGNTWQLEGSPQVALTPSAKDPVGEAVTLNTSTEAFRSADIGGYIEINGGLVKIASVSQISYSYNLHSGDGSTTVFAYSMQIDSAGVLIVEVGGVPQVLTTDYTLTGVGNPAGGTVVFTVAPAVGVNNISFVRPFSDLVTGTIVRELAATVEAPADSWALKTQVWNEVDGYPAAVTQYQQRLWAANNSRFLQSFWGSKSGLSYNFLPGDADDDAVYKTVDSRQSNPIRFLHSGKSIVALTDAGEFDIRGGVEKPITQSNASITRQSGWGCALVKPEEVGSNLLFVQRGGKVLRAVFPLDIEGFDARDVSIFSEHLLAAGVKAISFQQTPESIVWVVLDDGQIVAITYSTEQNVVALMPCSTDGEVESVCTVPEGTEDATYFVVKRAINGSTRRYVERLNWSVSPGMDSRAVGTGGPTVWAGFSHLEGKTVTVLADGVHQGTQVVTGGTVTTENAATTVVAGLPYVPSIELQTPEVPTKTGTSQAQAMSNNKVTVRLLDTTGCSVNDEALPIEQFGTDPLDGTMPVYTGDLDVTDYGWATGEAPIVISQPQPYPWTVLAVIRELTVNAG